VVFVIAGYNFHKKILGNRLLRLRSNSLYPIFVYKSCDHCSTISSSSRRNCYVRPPMQRFTFIQEKQRRVLSRGDVFIWLTRLRLVMAEESAIWQITGVVWPEQRPMFVPNRSRHSQANRVGAKYFGTRKHSLMISEISYILK